VPQTAQTSDQAIPTDPGHLEAWAAAWVGVGILMILGHGRRRRETSPGHRRAHVVRDLEASTVEAMSARSMEHNPRLFRERGLVGPSLGGCEASLVLSSTFQSPGPTSEGRPGDCDVINAGSDPVVVAGRASLQTLLSSSLHGFLRARDTLVNCSW
jgi:hypothetical protein